MKQFQTYYNNLQVSADATPEEIKQAYRRLSKKYHPDRNQHNTEAHDIMILVNEAYGVLSEPDKRAEHDRWIASQLNLPVLFDDEDKIKPVKTANKAWVFAGLIVLLLLILLLVFFKQASPPAPMMVKLTADKSSIDYQGEMVLLSPNGNNWGNQANYILGFPVLHATGETSMVVENNTVSAVFAQLYEHNNNHVLTAVRSFYIPAMQNFTLLNLDKKTYYIRYQLINNGRWLQSELIELE